jgi:hypothetical protein
MDDSTLFTVAAAAKTLDKPEWKIRDLERRGELPCVRTSGGMRLFSARSLEEYRRRSTPVRELETIGA